MLFLSSPDSRRSPHTKSICRGRSVCWNCHFRRYVATEWDTVSGFASVLLWLILDIRKACEDAYSAALHTYPAFIVQPTQPQSANHNRSSASCPLTAHVTSAHHDPCRCPVAIAALVWSLRRRGRQVTVGESELTADETFSNPLFGLEIGPGETGWSGALSARYEVEKAFITTATRFSACGCLVTSPPNPAAYQIVVVLKGFPACIGRSHWSWL